MRAMFRAMFHILLRQQLHIFLIITCLYRNQIMIQTEGLIKNDDACNLFKGNWVLDEAYPLYDTSACPFIEKEFDCQGNGRPDKLYLKYRWAPSACDVPRFNGEDFLKRMRGRKILFVGDSISLNQWQSLTCMLHASVPQLNYTLVKRTFTIPDYGVSVSLKRNPFLVDIVKEEKGRILKLESIKGGKEWIGYDMLVFNTWHWWLHHGKNQPWDYIEKGGQIYKDMDRLEAFTQGLATWAKWVSANTHPSRTRVFFQNISPSHSNGKEWNEKKTTCKGQTKPVSSTTYLVGSPPAAKVVEAVLSTAPVTLLNVTTLSQLRKDGHPSIYGKGATNGNDCSHWCLAGVPDTWNELLYALLVTNDAPKEISNLLY